MDRLRTGYEGRYPTPLCRIGVRQVIAALPEGTSARVDPGAVAKRLIALLPARVATNSRSSHPAPVIGTAAPHAAFTTVLVYASLMMLFLAAQWLLRH